MSNHALCPCCTTTGRGDPLTYSVMPSGPPVSAFTNSILLYPVSSHASPLLARTIGARATSAVPKSPEITASTFAGSHGGAVVSVSSAGGGSGSGEDGVGAGGDGAGGVDEAAADGVGGV